MGEFDHHRRTWQTAEENSNIRCFLGMRGRVTLHELIDHFAEHYPHVDPYDLELNAATVTWEEPPTEEDLALRAARQQAHDERHARWERETYERLKDKFEGGS